MSRMPWPSSLIRGILSPRCLRIYADSSVGVDLASGVRATSPPRPIGFFSPCLSLFTYLLTVHFSFFEWRVSGWTRTPDAGLKLEPSLAQTPADASCLLRRPSMALFPLKMIHMPTLTNPPEIHTRLPPRFPRFQLFFR